MVDVIHTDAWLYGAPVSTGTIDFWPNSGKTLQPGCPKRNYKMLSDNGIAKDRFKTLSIISYVLILFYFLKIYVAIEDHGDSGLKVLPPKRHLHFIQLQLKVGVILKKVV